MTDHSMLDATQFGTGGHPVDGVRYLAPHDKRFDDDGDHGAINGMPAGDRALELVEIALGAAIGAGTGSIVGPIGTVVGGIVGAAAGAMAGERTIHAFAPSDGMAATGTSSDEEGWEPEWT